MLTAFTTPAKAREYISHRLDGQVLLVETSDGLVRLTALGSDAIDVAYEPAGVKQLPSFALTGKAEVTPVTIEDAGTLLHFRTPTLTVTIEKNPLRLRYSRQGEELVAEESGLFANDKARGFRFRLTGTERLWGGGQRVLGMDRRGQILPLDNRASYGYSDRADVMYYGVPAVLSDRKYLLLFDNSARGEMDLGKTEPDILRFEAKGGRTAYVIVAGQTFADIVTNYVSVTGQQPLPPRWAFGNMASRFGYRSQAQAEDVVSKFAKDRIPLDAIIFDLFWFGPEIKGHMGNLDWDRNTFPAPDKMISDFKAKGINTILITEPFVLQTSKRWDEALEQKALARGSSGKPQIFDFYFGTGGLVDMFDPAAAQWFWAKNKALIDQGVTGIWGDLGEPEAHPSDTVHTPGWTADEVHNAYGHQWARIMSEKWKADYPGQRPFLMMRSGSAGTQRYGIIPWSGDVSKTWSALQAQVEIALQMSVMGLAYSHSDLGGFVALDSTSTDPEAAVPFDRELYIRWLQFGAFQPVFRPHSQEQIPSEPIFHDRKARNIIRRYIQWRYRLLPYLYTAAWENSQTGMPMTRPLAFANDRLSLFEEQSAFLWGSDMLVAPVTEKGAVTKSFPLVDGIWFDFWSDARHAGGQEKSVAVTLNNIPVFVRAGAFIPMIGDIMTTRDYRTDRLSIHYYHDATVTSSQGRMYDDDGKTADAHAQGRFELLNFESALNQQELHLNFARQRHAGYAGAPGERLIELVIHNWAKAPHQIMVDGQKLPPLKGRAAIAANAGYSYSAADRLLRIRFLWGHANVAVKLH